MRIFFRAGWKNGWNGLPARFRRQPAAESPGRLVARQNRPVACSTWNGIFKLGLACGLIFALAPSGCTTKSKALAQSRGAFIAGQQQGFAQAQAQTVSTNVTFLGDVRNRTVEWVEELTLTQGLVAADYLHPRDPSSITITRQGRKYEVSPKRLLKGLEDPYLEPGDVVELHR